MSKSQYKIKGGRGRQRSRSAKPYEKSKNLVTKVKSWLTPSSWLSYWSSSDTCEDDPRTPNSRNSDHPSTSGDHSRNSIGPVSHPELNTPRPLFDNNQFTPLGSSEGTSSSGAQHTNIPSRSQAESDNMAFSTASSKDIQMSFNSQVSKSPTLSAFGNSLVGDRDVSSSSNESWVAEDTEYATGKDDPKQLDIGIAPGKRKKKLLETSPLSRTKHPTRDSLELVDGSADFARALTPVQAGGSGIEEHTVQFVSNPAFSNRANINTAAINKTPPKRKTLAKNQTVHYSQKDTSGFSADFSRRLYSASTSTPQLSPVHEQLEENMQQDIERATSPFNPVGVSFNPLSQSFNRTLDQSSTTVTMSLTAPSRTYTDESIRRSPFRSPFYSGRTSFGGASSGQKMRLKRPRTESSPPVLAPLRVSVRARPAPSLPNASTHQSVVSRTAKKIMDTLDSLSSPLTDARKLPMRNLPPEMQQAKRRRLTDNSVSGNTILSPPPVTPLHTSTGSHSFTSQTQIVPNERTSPRKQQSNSSVNLTDGGFARLPSSLVSTTTTTNSLATKLKFSLPQFTSVSPSNQPSVLSSLTFSAPPLPQQSNGSPDRPERQTSDSLENDRSPQASSVFKPSFHSVGKMSRRSRGARTRHPAREEEEEEEEYVNPVAPPPQVGLSLGQGGSLPTFTFHAQLLSEKKSISPKSQAPTLPVTGTLSSTPSFSFANPTPVHTDASLPSTTAPKGAFGFSAPKVQTSNISLSQSSLPVANSLFSSSLPPASLSKQHPPPTLNANQLTGPRPSETTKPCPPLKNMSVVDALKRPEYSQFLPTDKTKKNILGEMPKSSGRDVVDLTNSDDEDDSPLQRENKPLSNPLSKFAPVSGTWSCHVCLVNNSAKDLKCVACQTDKIGSKDNSAQDKTHSISGGLQMESGNGRLQGMKLGTKIPGGASSLRSATLKPLPQSGPPAGSWECGTCLIRNKPTDEKCVACSSAKPAPKVSTSTLKPLPQFGPPAGSWECGTCLIKNKPTDEKCVACSSAKPAPKVSTSTLKPLPQFGPPAGSWECGTCLIKNKPTDEKCVACSSAKPAPKVSTSGTAKDSTVTTGHTKSVAQVTNSSLTPLTSVPPMLSWTCDTCLVQNKAEDNKCIACTTPKPGGKKDSQTSKGKGGTTGLNLGASGGFSLGNVSLSALATPKGKQQNVTTQGVEDPKKTSGLVLGSSGGFQLGAGVSLGGATSNLPSTNISFGTTGTLANSQSSTKSNNNGKLESKPELLKPASSELPFKQLPGSKPTEKVLFGAPTSTASGPSTMLLAGSSESLLSKSITTISNSSSPLVGITLGGNLKTDKPLSGIKFGGVLQTTPSGTPGIKLGGGLQTTSSITPLTGIQLGGTPTPLTGIKLGGGLQTTSSSTSLTGIQLGGTPLSGTPLTGINVGGDLQPTSSSTPLTGLKLGGGNSISTPGIKLGGGLQTTSSSTPLTGIKLGDGRQTSFSTNPMGGIKLGGTFPVPSSALGDTNPSTTTLGTGLSTSTFVFGQTPTSDPQQNTQKQETSLFKFTGATTSSNPLSGIPPSSIFGTQQTQPLSLNLGSISSTPLGDAHAQTEMLSQDHDMNVEQDRSEQSQSLMFGTLKKQQPALSSNIFGSQPQQPIASQNASFNFHANPQSGSAGESKGANMSNAIFKFGSGSSNSLSGFSFSGSTQKPAAESAKSSGSGVKSSLFQPNVQSSSTSGFNFGSSSEMNLNFAPSQPIAQNTSQTMFTVGSTTTSNRLIKKARRRKPALS